MQAPVYLQATGLFLLRYGLAAKADSLGGNPPSQKLCHICDTKPVLAAKTDFFDDVGLLILWNLLKTQVGRKFPAYRLARYFL
jgi:hypothetical protein